MTKLILLNNHYKNKVGNQLTMLTMFTKLTKKILEMGKSLYNVDQTFQFDGIKA